MHVFPVGVERRHGGVGVVAQLRVLDDAVRNVDAKAGDAAVEPEAQDVVEGVADLGVPPVQIGLLGQEVVEVVLPGVLVERPGRGAAEAAAPVVRRRAAGPRIGPDVPVAAARATRGAGLLEPRMQVGGVVRDEVEDHLDPAGGSRGDQLVERGQTPNTGWTSV